MLLPWWVYFVIFGIVLSGFMVLYTAKQEQDEEQEYIEQEGEVYMSRIKEERNRRLGLSEIEETKG
ncbi:MAG: sporulation YhaL family protein [Bacillaceae bacterium]